ncbi:hypothetical protein BDQ17DRAFT_1432443 [Cyathus striatus]|nr:hypothetical protein BDQ17DRAFT_1432443 [Cyathus striatus]
MSQLETLPAAAVYDFPSTPVGEHHSTPSLRLTAPPEKAEHIFAGLPPLHSGHPEVHLREGIMNAALAAAAGESDAEKAFFVADLSVVYHQHMRWINALPEVQPFYAVKCNPDPYILRLLASLGTGFDCASINEISSVLSLSPTFSPNKIIYANPTKAASFIRSAARMGVHTMTFDNADELHKIKRVNPNARLVLRILTDDSKSLCQFGIKFGAPLSTVPSLLALARELELEVIGVFDMAKEFGFRFTLLDRAFSEGGEGGDGVLVIAEPGRFYVSKAMRLAVCVIARRAPVEDPEEGEEDGKEDMPKVMYYINDGVYGSFNCILFDHQLPIPTVLSLGGSFHIPPSLPSVQSSIWGPTCDSIDCVSKGILLPKALRVGDWLGFENMGAYTLCAASQFNGFEVSKVVYTSGGMGEGRLGLC